MCNILQISGRLVIEGPDKALLLVESVVLMTHSRIYHEVALTQRYALCERLAVETVVKNFYIFLIVQSTIWFSNTCHVGCHGDRTSSL